jgi:hypothetical protein
MHKLLVFDLDGTLAELGKGMLNEDIVLLRELEQQGYRIAICSGKPTYYLCGFMRQVGIENPILVGENGACFQFGVDLPPSKHCIYPHSERAKWQMKHLRTLIDATCGDRVWYQPNEVALTPFPQDADTFDEIQAIFDAEQDNIDELQVYRHVDSYDITPKNINKCNGLAYLLDMLQLEQKDMIAVGDWLNDVPMFECADCSIRITNRMDYPADYAFDTIGEALRFLRKQKI